MSRKKDMIRNLSETFHAEDIVLGVCTEILTPSIDKMKSKHHFKSLHSTQQIKKFISDCQTKETIQAIKLNEAEKSRNYQKIKRSLMQYCRYTGKSKASASHFKTKQNLNIPDEVNRVDISRKYNACMSIKMQALSEAQKIDEYKTWIKKWTGQTNFLKSPNVKKMNFLIEKITQKKGVVPEFAFKEFKRVKPRKTVPITKHYSTDSYTGLSAVRLKNGDRIR